MRAFVAGATGVVGRRVVPELVRRGHEVTAVARSAEKARALERAGATAVVVDLFDAARVRRALDAHDVVINLATHIPSGARLLFPSAWRENDRVRRDASRVLAEAALVAGASRFIQESFALIYPDLGDDWIDESVPVAPAPHARSTGDAERSALRFAEGGGTGVALRFAGFYGPDSPQFAQMAEALRRGWAPLPGAPAAYWPALSHDDAASAVLAALELPSGIYNVADDRPLPRGVLMEETARALGAARVRHLPRWVERLMGSIGETIGRSQRLSNRKLRDASGWRPRWPSAIEGWRETISAMREGRDTAAVPRAAASPG